MFDLERMATEAASLPPRRPSVAVRVVRVALRVAGAILLLIAVAAALIGVAVWNKETGTNRGFVVFFVAPVVFLALLFGVALIVISFAKAKPADS